LIWAPKRGALMDFYASIKKHHYEHISIELLAFCVKYISGQFTLTDHDTIEWVAPEELLNYDLAEADIPIAHQLKSGT